MPRFVFASALLLASCGASAVPLAQSTPIPSSPAESSSHQPMQGKVRPDERNCIRDTGSLIPARKGHCLPVAGRSYSQQDLQRTGRPDLGSVLQKLDPSITVRGH
jgi:hypothetical protein